MGGSQNKQNIVQKTFKCQQILTQSTSMSFHHVLKEEIIKLKTIQRKVRMKLDKAMTQKFMQKQKGATASLFLMNQKQMQRYNRLDVFLQDALLRITSIKTLQLLINFIKQLAQTLGISYEAMKKVKTLQQAITSFEQQIGKQIQHYNVLSAEEQDNQSPFNNNSQQTINNNPPLPIVSPLNSNSKPQSNFIPPSSETPNKKQKPVQQQPMTPSKSNIQALTPQMYPQHIPYRSIIERPAPTQDQITKLLKKFYPPKQQQQSNQENKNKKP